MNQKHNPGVRCSAWLGGIDKRLATRWLNTATICVLAVVAAWNQWRTYPRWWAIETKLKQLEWQQSPPQLQQGRQSKTLAWTTNDDDLRWRTRDDLVPLVRICNPRCLGCCGQSQTLATLPWSFGQYGGAVRVSYDCPPNDKITRDAVSAATETKKGTK